MAILAFQQPEKVIMIESDDMHGLFEFRPLEPGYGMTIGNALRRILLSSLEGFAITSVRIEGVSNEFGTIEGVMEDMTEIILNLKQIRFKRKIMSENGETLRFTLSDKKVFKAGDINKFLNAFQVINTDLKICHMESSIKLNIEINIEKGRGYVPSEENKKPNDVIGTIAIDSIYTPIKNVKFSIDNYRVEQKTDYEKLFLDITTDGSISPKDALKDAASILISHFMLFADDDTMFIHSEEPADERELDETALHMRQLLQTRLKDMDLSVRALNCLKAADVETLGDLVSFNKGELLKFRNFGKKSLTELESLVRAKNLEFGMDVTKYKLDKE
ncbi:MAG: DNA-directed RNA polymerase subunit alpha [Bacteroidales bacterium]|jgi:DNA-directed RNA polymerase subunit alpha|nr:DNA-directed RNA polymerase subunit alpha [Bacteroidales bacterium]